MTLDHINCDGAAFKSSFTHTRFFIPDIMQKSSSGKIDSTLKFKKLFHLEKLLLSKINPINPKKLINNQGTAMHKTFKKTATETI